MKTSMLKNNKGFTLTELITAGMIGAMVSGVMLAVLAMNVKFLNQGMAQAAMQSRYMSATEQIARHVRTANAVLGPNEIWNASLSLPENEADTLVLYDNDGKFITSYRIAESALQEWNRVAGTWKYFKTGDNIVQVTANSHFKLAADRKSAMLQIIPSMTYKNAREELSFEEVLYTCRN